VRVNGDQAGSPTSAAETPAANKRPARRNRRWTPRACCVTRSATAVGGTGDLRPTRAAAPPSAAECRQIGADAAAAAHTRTPATLWRRCAVAPLLEDSDRRRLRRDGRVRRVCAAGRVLARPSAGRRRRSGADTIAGEHACKR
jgi:hypothetical protein